MNLKALKCFATPHVAPIEGQEFSCPDNEAQDLIKAGYAEAVNAKQKIEKRGEEEPETKETETKGPEADESERVEPVGDSVPSKRSRRKPAK